MQEAYGASRKLEDPTKYQGLTQGQMTAMIWSCSQPAGVAPGTYPNALCTLINSILATMGTPIVKDALGNSVDVDFATQVESVNNTVMDSRTIGTTQYTTIVVIVVVFGFISVLNLVITFYIMMKLSPDSLYNLPRTLFGLKPNNAASLGSMMKKRRKREEKEERDFGTKAERTKKKKSKKKREVERRTKQEEMEGDEKRPLKDSSDSESDDEENEDD